MPEGAIKPVASRAPNSKPVSNTAPAPMRASKLHAAGMPKLYDPGLASTLVCKSSITFLNGSAGILRYRGYPIEQLATKVAFDEVAHLLLFKTLPTRTQLGRFRASLCKPYIPEHTFLLIRSFPTSAHPMTILISALASLTSSFPHLNPAVDGNNVYKSEANRSEVITTVLGMMPLLASAILHHTQGQTIQRDTYTQQRYFHSSSSPPAYTQRYFQLAFPNSSIPPELIKALDTLFILHADHEQNCSTSAVRHLASSGVDVFSALSSGVAALYGPLHGGACEAVVHMLTRIGHVDNVDKFVDRVKNRQELLMGFGHRVYRTYDPRAKIVRSLVREVLRVVNNSDDPLIQVATKLEHAALNDQYFISRKLYPNIDFYSGIIYKCIGNIHPSYFGMFFALGRVSGWLAHWLEYLDDEDRRIVRPYQWYTGPSGPLQVPNFDEREHQSSELQDDKNYAKL